jgi:hypothetical protein
VGYSKHGFSMLLHVSQYLIQKTNHDLVTIKTPAPTSRTTFLLKHNPFKKKKIKKNKIKKEKIQL